MFDLLDRFEPSQTFAQIARAWLDCKAGNLRPDWLRECQRLLSRDILPSLGDKPRPSRRDISAALEPLPRGVRRNAHTVVSAVLSWAVETGRLDGSPMVGLKRPPARSRDRVLSLPELRSLWGATGDGSDHSRIVRLLALTACRRDEIGDLRWCEVDAGEGRIVLPGARTKNGHRHSVPLSPLALAQLPKRRVGRPYVFGRRRASGFSGWSRCKERLDARLGSAVEPWRLHDLRRSAASHWVEGGLADVDLAELALNHRSGKRGGIVGVYVRGERWSERVRLAERWAIVRTRA